MRPPFSRQFRPCQSSSRFRPGLEHLEDRCLLTATPHLLKDVNTSEVGSSPTHLVQAGSVIYFTADDGVHGRELWRTDGTPAGTSLVKDIVPGPAGAELHSLTAVGGTLYFLAYDPDHGVELWKSDGTGAGTVRVKDINPGPGGSDASSLTALNDTLFFTAYDPDHGYELWKSDGTEAGTVRVKDINPGIDDSYPSDLRTFGGKLYFSAFDFDHGSELWTSDGSEAGTVRVKDIVPDADGSNPIGITVGSGGLFFSAFDPDLGVELWTSDGTEAGTVLVKDIHPGTDSSSPFGFVESGGAIYFLTLDDFTGQLDLWRTDGTEPGTVPVMTNVANFFAADFAGVEMVDVAGVLYFTTSDPAHGREVWRTDGTEAGTSVLRDVFPGTGSSNPAGLVAFNDTLYFTATDPAHGRELWKSNGTEAGTVLVKDFRPGTNSSRAEVVGVAAGSLFLAADDGLLGRELWKTDGTEVGTLLVKNLNTANASSSPLTFVASGGKTYFPTQDGSGQVDLWRTDGTAGGTVLVRQNIGNINDGTPAMFDQGGTLLFVGHDPDHGYELWRTDGTGPGTVLVKDLVAGPDSAIIFNFVSSGGVTYFMTHDVAANRIDLWRTDGTGAGTTLVKAGVSSFFTRTLVDVGGKLFFVGYQADGEVGQPRWELWTSDGTTAGTVVVKATGPGDGWSALDDLTAFGGAVYFFANDFDHGYGLWKSNGTPAGTVLVADLPDVATTPRNLGAANGSLYFTGSDSKLWKSNGTAGGTAAVGGDAGGIARWAPRDFLAFAGKTYFLADDDSSRTNLWVTNGTAAGTTLVKTNAGGGMAIRLGELYFSASDTAHGYELWKTDGTTAPVLVTDIRPDSESSSPTALLAVSDALFFTADDGTHGAEPWVLMNSPPLVPDQTLSVPENSPGGTTVGTVVAIDIDGDELTFEVTGGTGQSLFAIDVVTGEVIVKSGAVLDYESTPSYSLVVRVTDNGVPAKSTTATITINLLDVNESPTITGTVANQAINDNATLKPFQSVVIADVDTPAQSLTVTVTLSAAANGTFTPASLSASGFADLGSGIYRFIGTAAQATAAIRQLVFAPTANQVLPGSTVTTTFTVKADDLSSPAATNSVTTVIAISVNDPPTISGTQAGQAVNDNATLAPFAGVTIADPDSAQSLTVTVTLSAAANGAFTAASLSASGFADLGSGVYRFVGTATQATAAIRQLVFAPTANQVLPGSTVTTTFTITANDGLASPTTNAATTVVATSVNDAPTISGTQAGQAVNDNATLTPFTGVTIADPDSAQTLTVTVTLSAAANGAFTAASLTASGFTDLGGGDYQFQGTAAQATAAIRQLVFAPTANQVLPGSTVTTTFTITANDGLASPTTNAATTVVATSVNDAPTISGTQAGQAVNDNATLTPFTGVTIADPDSSQSLTVTVTLSAAANGTFTAASLSASGFASQGNGVYQFIGTAAQATAAIRQLVFAPTANQVPPGSTVTTTFTITAADGVAGPATDDGSTVIATSINDVPRGRRRNYQVARNGTLSVPKNQGVLKGATDPDIGTRLKARVKKKPTRGTLSLRPNGAFTYTPPPNFVGLVTFTVIIRDNHNGQSKPVRMTIRVV